MAQRSRLDNRGLLGVQREGRNLSCAVPGGGSLGHLASSAPGLALLEPRTKRWHGEVSLPRFLATADRDPVRGTAGDLKGGPRAWGGGL